MDIAPLADVPAERTHVLLVVDDDILHRFGPTIRQLCVGLVDEPIRPTVLCPAHVDAESLRVGGARVVTFGSLRWPLRGRSMRKVIQALGGDEPDLVHATSGHVARLARAIAAEFDVPLIVHLTGLGELTAAAAAAAEAAPPSSATEYIAISTPILDAARRVLRDRAEHITLIRPGIHAGAAPACFPPDRQTAALISFTRFTANSGLLTLLEVMRDLVRHNADLMLFLLGSGPLEPQLRRRVIELGLLRSVTFSGSVTNRKAVTDAGDILVSTRRQSELRVHPLEAMAAGMAIVAAAGGIDDWLIDEQTAYLFDPASPDQLALQLSQLLEHREPARTLAARAQDYVRHQHQPSAMVAAVSRLYQRLALDRKTVKLHRPT